MASLVSRRALLQTSRTSKYWIAKRPCLSTSTSTPIEAIPIEATSPSEATLGEASIPRQSPLPNSQRPNDAPSTVGSPSQLLKYHISRTPSNNLPVYHDTRNGNTRKETIIRKIAGDPRPLKEEIQQLLDLAEDRVWVGKVTRHVYVKGHHKPAIERFLRQKGF